MVVEDVQRHSRPGMSLWRPYWHHCLTCSAGQSLSFVPSGPPGRSWRSFKQQGIRVHGWGGLLSFLLLWPASRRLWKLWLMLSRVSACVSSVVVGLWGGSMSGQQVVVEQNHLPHSSQEAENLWRRIRYRPPITHFLLATPKFTTSQYCRQVSNPTVG